MQNAIQLEHVSRRFGQLTAVDDLSLSVKEGEIFGLLGPNGAGKTTTLNLSTGMLWRDQGEIQVLGFDPQYQAQEVRRIIGLVSQETNVYEDLNAIDNMRHHAALYCQDLKGIERKIEDLLSLMELWERRKDPLRTYSGGMKRRLALARALLHEPQIIFFDEPTQGVDVQGRHVLWEHVRSEQLTGKTFIISTNNMAEADALADRLVIIDHGRAIVEGTPEELKSALGRDIISLQTAEEIQDPYSLLADLEVQNISRHEPLTLRFEIKNGDQHIAAIIEHISRQNTLQSIRVSRPTLDDVFLHYTGRALRE